MKVSVIISVCDNREDLFDRSLYTWSKQTMPKEDWEFVIVDDEDRTDFKILCKKSAERYNFNIQYINIDNSKSLMPVKTFIPVVSSNVGFRQSRGEVVVITGPETLQSENNLKIAYTFMGRKEVGYGLVYKSNINFVDYLKSNWNNYTSFNQMLSIQGSKSECLTRPPHPPGYAYFIACAKKNIEKINGFDEKFASGFCAEDDDLANRLKKSGINPVFEHKIIGIHQDHTRENSLEHNKMRKTKNGDVLRKKNINLMFQNKKSKNFIANIMTKENPIFVDGVKIPFDPEYKWGDPRVIVDHIIY